MLIAIDYDGTFARDMHFFRAFVVLGKRFGHRFVLVTGRSDEGQWGAEVRREVWDIMPIVFAANAWKREAARRAGYEVDIWIDDKPEGIDRLDPAAIARRDEYTREGQK